MKNLIFPLIFPPLQNEILLPEKAAGQEVQQSERWEAFSWDEKEDKRMYNSCYSNRLPRLITFASQWPTTRHCERSEAIQFLSLVIASEAKQSSY